VQNIGEQGEAPDPLDGLFLDGEFQQLEIRQRYPHLFGLAAPPAAKI
jgi:hypothetical protein